MTTIKNVEQWICWKKRKRNGDISKVPVNPNDGTLSSINDRDTWCSYEKSCQYHKKHSNIVAGIGFVFTENDDFVGVDFDNCIENNILNKETQEIVDKFDTYCERTVSNRGLHLILQGTKKGTKCKKQDIYGCQQIEIYDKNRFFVYTGWVYQNNFEIRNCQTELDDFYDDLFPSTMGDVPNKTYDYTLSDEVLIHRACNSKNGERFRKLWNGDMSDYGGDHSRSDLSLCCMLCFWTGGNRDRIDKLFRQSGLCRSKWINREDYRSRTINKSLVISR